MEFAVEAQKLISISLEGSGMTALLQVKGLKVQVEDNEISTVSISQ